MSGATVTGRVVKMIYRMLKRILALALLSFILAVGYVLAKSSPEPWSGEEVSRLTIGLNEAAAIGVPHGFLMSKPMRQANLALLQKVERGEILNNVESLAYRHIFQTVLHDSQRFLSAFDAELTVLPDVAMTTANNVSSLGIAGNHDHHDVSARKNFAGLLQSLHQLDKASNVFSRIHYANATQKDLVDLISHMGVAPHTVSVPYVPPDTSWPDAALGGLFEAMTKAFKDAQFETVNSPAYWTAVDTALARYSDLILAVQQRVVARTSNLERRVAGRFNSVQTGAPPVDLNRPLRRK